MASVRQYGYYIKGNKVAIVEKDTAFDNDANSRDYGPGSNRAQWKSPLATIVDGIEIQYVYSPEYHINETDDVTTVIDTYVSLGGLLKIIDQGDTAFNTSPESLSDGDFIVLRNAGKWNGLHEVKDAGTGYITTYTKCSDSASVQQSFEKTVSLYYNVDALNDEDDTIQVSSYLSKAVVYYVKAKIAEDMMNIELKEYCMKEFRKMVEKYNNTRVAGLRIQAAGPHAIR